MHEESAKLLKLLEDTRDRISDPRLSEDEKIAVAKSCGAIRRELNRVNQIKHKSKG